MANENNNLTPMQKLADNLTLVLRELWNEASAQFATKQETGASFASTTTCEAIVSELV
jgi:hypothetical protein